MKMTQKGFTILEVMIALSLFAMFAVVMIYTQVSNKDMSIRMAGDLELHNLAQMKMNETIIMREELSKTSENDPDTGSFEIEGFEHFKYKVEYKQNVFPDFAGIMGKTEEETTQVDPNAAVKKLIFDKMKKNVEEMIWQVKVTITNTQSDAEYELNSWITKPNAKIDTNFTF